MHNKKRFKFIGSCVLALCLVCSLVLSGNTFGVRAEEGTQQASQTQETQQDANDDSAKETSKASDSKTDAAKQTADDSKKSKGATQAASDNEITFDLAKGSVSFTDSTYTGYDKDGNKLTGDHDPDNKYVIEQSNAETATNNTIKVGTTSTAVTKKYAIYLAGINIKVANASGIPIYVNSDGEGAVYLILKDGTSNKAELNYTDGANVHAAVEKEVGTSGLLCITCEKGYTAYQQNIKTGHSCQSNDNCGKLTAYGNRSRTGTANPAYKSGAGIGSKGGINGGSIDNDNTVTVNTYLDNLVVSGGFIDVYGATGDSSWSGGGAAIGLGGSADPTSENYTSAGIRNLSITGGNINAYAGDNSAACIGGGYRSNKVDIAIYGGTIDATNRVKSNQIRGAGIGAGGGGTRSGSPSIATVKIYGGTIKASSEYGAGIGGAGGGDGMSSTYNPNCQPAYVYIYGGNIDATSSGIGAGIGSGGPIGASTKGSAGEATVEISGNAVVNAISEAGADIGGGGVESGKAASNGGKATVTIKSGNVTALKGGIGGGLAVAGTGGAATVKVTGGTVETPSIGGGNSSSNNGGDASVSVSGGLLNVAGKIGGGNSAGSGNGGDASIYVTGGTLDCASVGGGNSATGTPGAVNSDENPAGVTVTKGTVKAGTIGGGTNDNDDIGFATADISGGTIQGQFILANTDSSKKCTFNMTGGTIDNSGLGSGKYTRAQDNGGAVYLTDDNGEVTLNGGTIKSSHGVSGGAIYLAGKNGKVSVGGTTIEDCYAKDGGAVYMTNGEFTLAGNSDKGGIIQDCKASSDGKTIDGNGGAVYLEKGTVTASGGTIGLKDHPNQAVLGGGVYLASGSMDITGGSVAYNSASSNGGGAYLDGGTLTMTNGKLTGNTATERGGGAYVSGGNFKLNGKDAAVSSNTAKNGAGIYLTGGTPELLAGALTENTASANGGGIYIDKQDVDFAPTGTVTVSGNSAVNGGGVYIGGTKSDRGGLSVDKNSTGSMQFLDNKATTSGGGACVDYGSFELDSDKVTMQGNSAVNGGGVAVLNGSFTQSGGTIGGSSGKLNTADNGGAVYVSGGDFTLNDGMIQNNRAKNGGGVFAAEGKVRMFGGSITSNTATADGGGMYVSSTGDPADVVLRSGNLSSNTAGNSDDKTGNGGGLAVVSSQGSQDHVIIGLNEKHLDLNPSTRKFTAFDYDDAADNNKSHNHASCMIMENNLANGNGGGIYMGSTGATLDIYCLQENGNTSVANATGGSVMASGGQVNIGDKDNNDANARGNIVINTPMLVSGGDVDIWGNMKNPYFENNILVDIKNGAGSFEDHRTSTDKDDHHYKVQYFENFFGSGIYSAVQYSTTEDVSALGTLFTHEGYKIVEWNTSADGKGTSYPIGTKIGSATDHRAWTNGVNDPLILYAIWEKVKYTVKYDPNATEYTAVTPMADQTFEYGVEQELAGNTYRVTGKRFTGWNTEKDGTGTDYAADYKESKMTQEDGSTITLYAQWVDCTHKDGEHPGEITYTIQDDNTIIESCDCGGHKASVKLSAVDVYHDGLAHPATLTYSGDALLAGNPEIIYQYSATENGTYGALLDGETVPTSVGYYQASITVGDKTVTVTYQIKSPATGITITGEGASGQIFADFNGSQTVSAAKDDAVTLQYTMQNLNKETYTTAPKLIFDQALLEGTSIIMMTGDQYWYCNSLAGKKTVALSDFTAMGGTESFVYNISTAAANQKYQFVVDYSKAETQLNGTVNAAFLYEYTANPDEFKQEADVSIDFGEAGSFGLEQTVSNGNQVKITAPEAVEYNRWNYKSLLLKVAASEDAGTLPSDAKLTVTVSGKTQVYTLSKAGEFIVPLSWAEAQTAVFSLDSDLAGQQGKDWNLTAKLFMASTNGNNPIPASLMDTGQSCNMKLTIPADDSPSLRITGNKHLLTNSEVLPVKIEMENVDDATVHATIQKKVDGGTDYTGNFLSVDVEDNLTHNHSFNLGGITEAGSYRLLVTVTKNNQTLLSVPYYFIVK